MRQVIVYPGEDGWWVVECPSLPGCISQGETKEKAILNIKEAIQGYVAALQEDGLPVTEEKPYDSTSGQSLYQENRPDPLGVLVRGLYSAHIICYI